MRSCYAVAKSFSDKLEGQRRTGMQTPGNPSAASASARLTPEALVEIQQKTIAEHIKHEEAKDWPEVSRTFTPHAEDAYYDVVPLQMRFQKMKGVMDFYQAFTRG